MTPLDEDGLVRLAEAERGALVAFARRRLGSGPDEAEDAVQDALVKALRAVRRGARPERGRAWLFTILAHCCADARAGAARRTTVPVP
ncbi:MAG: Sigma-70 region 2, partial [Solirubrobacterales bacterium]|nr:Sigma-70 region 2 [Solirubrobacterales bacterium]